jgi:hypothetical protein
VCAAAAICAKLLRLPEILRAIAGAEEEIADLLRGVRCRGDLREASATSALFA